MPFNFAVILIKVRRSFILSNSLLTFCFSYNPDFRLADYSACHLLARWFLAEFIS
jgi:hypothetical protein